MHVITVILSLCNYAHVNYVLFARVIKFLICARQLWYLILTSPLTWEGRYHNPYFIGGDAQAQRGETLSPRPHSK